MLTESPQPVNKRRKSRFKLVGQRHIMPVLLGALAATIILHFLGFTVLNLLGAGLRVFDITKDDLTDQDVPIVFSSEDDRDDITPDPVRNEAPEELVEVEPPENMKMPDFEDIPFEEVIIAPGETVMSEVVETTTIMEALGPEANALGAEALKAGMKEPVYTEMMMVNDNPIKIKTPENPRDLDPDEWYKEQLKGAGGDADSTIGDGTTTLKELLAMRPDSMGKNTGPARLGADLLFEYDKAVLKNSSRISLLQLAAIMYKNPETIFIIEGHTDSFGGKDYNTLLSLMRANAVRKWLADNGIDLSRVYIRACGSLSPVVSTEGDKSRQAANRRVEIHMRKKGEELPPGALDASYQVDMDTPVAKQLANRISLPEAGQTQSRPVSETPATPPLPVEEIRSAEPVEEDIPQAEPVDDGIPVAVPA